MPKKGTKYTDKPSISKEYKKKYYEENKEKILSKMYEKKHCDVCDKMVPKCNFNRHCRSKKHIKNSE